MAKLPLGNYIALALVGVFVITGGLYASKQLGLLEAAAPIGGGDDGSQDIAIVSCPLTAASTVTLATPDVYGGAAVASQNTYRKVGESTFTTIAGAGTFSGWNGNKYEICAGVNTSNSTAQPYGNCIIYTVPCDSNPIASIPVVDDALATDLTVTAFNPENNTVIASGTEVDIDNGDVFNIEIHWQSSFEEDFGNRYCGVGNTLVVSFNTSQYTNMYATDLNGNQYPTTVVPSSFSTSAGYTNKAFEVPVLQSNAIWEFYLVTDASGTGKAPDGGTSNITLSLYDSHWYEDNDVTPPQIKCGVNDEDGSDTTGASAADTLTIGVVDD